ncbi:sensor signal transduction histidine kinase [Sphingomonas sp. LH128]|uniref:histidine kinase n=1 Tax=Novosphingobium resinovorum TaxID=158500 RepID=A0A1D8A1R5_9SPHN|nr:PAS domain-containing sensor histidine kinase [Novosphingobium resinovorum]EJU14108.1 sensor signal transduction histidine kinase [Sphingomonas sp. LH128]MBF7011435.1 HAMP domain-containing histidine kinase [Novosphingobium sp. HR1a]
MQVAARRANFFAVMEVLSVVAFLTMTVTTWLAINSGGDRRELLPSNLTASLLVGTLVPAMAILVLLGRRMALRRAAEHATGGTGQMHVRLVFIFSLIAAIPTLLVVVFASWLFQSGVEFWFSDSSRGLLENANKLARGYYDQTLRDVGYESVAMATDSRAELSRSPVASREFQAFLSFHVIRRNLSGAAIIQIDASGEQRTPIIVDPDGVAENNRISKDGLERLDKGEPYVVSAKDNRIVAAAPIERSSGVYLLVVRSSDLLSLSQGERAENIVLAYEALTSQARVLQLRFNVALFVASLALVGLSVWFALRFADRQVEPLYQLVDAARRVGAGNYALRIEGRTGADEIGLLNRAFNRMTAQIDKQTQALLGANSQLHERSVFIEAVLESVTSGIISLDEGGRILLMNSTAQMLLTNRAQDVPEGMPIAELAPSIAALVEQGTTSGIVQYNRGGDLLTLAVKTSRDATGHVITFEDITRQLLDQRTAAWSDVARRIAHEIKNPLTPIQLATERLSRRYRKQITDNPELFEDLTRTIIRQVGELRKMVDEFSSFARLPKPVFRTEDPVALTRQALFLQEVARPDIDFRFSAGRDIRVIDCDRHQFGQAMTNVLKNAVEAIEVKSKDAGEDYRGAISVEVADQDDSVVVRVTDNGIGLSQDKERLIEPYVTTREKGTGLGLAIVNKIIEEHGGEMTFTAAQGGGTTVTMRFAHDPPAQEATSSAPARKPEAAQ